MNGHPIETVHRIGVLLATRNAGPWLKAQVESIYSQVDVALTLTVADDASTDDTWPWLQATLGHRGDTSLIRHAQASGSAGANFRKLFVEADLGDAEYIALADQDDVWAPDKLRRAIDLLVLKKAAACSSSVEAFWPDGKTQTLSQSPHIRAADFLFEGAGQGCTFVMTRSFFDKVSAFCREKPQQVEELHYHDWMIYLLARAWGYRWTFDIQPSIRYRQHGSNEIGARHGLHAVKRRLQLIRSGWFRRQVGAASRLYLAAGGKEVSALATAQRFASERPSPLPWANRIGLALSLVRVGRRRISDRSILVIAALAGWL